MSLEERLKLALDVGREAANLAAEADAIAVPGGAAMSLHVIPALEEEFGKTGFYKDEPGGLERFGAARHYPSGQRLGLSAGK